MRNEDTFAAGSTGTEDPTSPHQEAERQWRRVLGRRSFLKGVGLAGAAAIPGSALLYGFSFSLSNATTGITRSFASFIRPLPTPRLH